MVDPVFHRFDVQFDVAPLPISTHLGKLSMGLDGIDRDDFKARPPVAPLLIEVQEPVYVLE
ncbi:MAG: hypothetical protein NWR42_08190, partial [Desulfobacterales bacterium]|nr:hypothetical protein [Desulfobacterales bacterium]